jgi:hypothetical protein
MNNRLKELYRSCRSKESLASQDEFNSDNVLLGLEVEKFAELILADVIAIINNPQTYNKCVFTSFDESKSKCITIELVKEINQQFKDVK